MPKHLLLEKKLRNIELFSLILNFFHPKVGETTGHRAMEKTGSYRHYLTACKKCSRIGFKAWNSCPLLSNWYTIFKFLVFLLILNEDSNFFASIFWNFCNVFNSKFSFLQYIVPFLRSRLKPGRVSARFHWNWSEFQKKGRVSVKLGTKKGPFFCAFLA